MTDEQKQAIDKAVGAIMKAHVDAIDGLALYFLEKLDSEIQAEGLPSDDILIYVQCDLDNRVRYGQW